MGEHDDLKPKNMTKKVDTRDYVEQTKEWNASTEKEFNDVSFWKEPQSTSCG